MNYPDTMTLEEEFEAIGKEIIKVEKQLESLKQAPSNGSINAEDMLIHEQAKKEDEALRESLEQVIKNLKGQYEERRQKIAEGRQADRKQDAQQKLDAAEKRLLEINKEFVRLADRQRALVEEIETINNECLASAQMIYSNVSVNRFIGCYLKGNYLAPKLDKMAPTTSTVNNFIWGLNGIYLYPPS